MIEDACRGDQTSVKPLVSLVTLNWKRAADTITCIESIKRVGYPALDVIVVDNGSSDGSAGRIRRAHPDVAIIENAANLGFAEGNNTGIRHALDRGADHILLLNNDTIVDPNIVHAFLEATRTLPHAGFLGAKIHYHAEPTRIWMGMPRWNPSTCRFDHAGVNEIDDGQSYNTNEEVAYACGCALFVSATVIREIGLMDPRYFCYFEEVDWCWRGREKGYRSYYVPDARVLHKVSVSSGGKTSPAIRYYRTRNMLMVARRHLSPVQRRRVLHNSARDALGHMGWRDGGPTDTLKRVYWNLLTIKNDPGIKAWRRGVLDYFLRRYGECPPAIASLSPDSRQD